MLMLISSSPRWWGCLGIAESAKKLAKAGKSVDEAVAAVGDPESKRHGLLHLGAAAGKVEMCKLLIEDFQANVDATDVQGNLI
jgi:hypothetical protein